MSLLAALKAAIDAAALLFAVTSAASSVGTVFRAVSEDKDLGIPNMNPIKLPTAQHAIPQSSAVHLIALRAA
jgi:hypothetical protein